jgi:hypothetical protein
VVDVQTGPEPAALPGGGADAADGADGAAPGARDHWIGLVRVTRVRLVVTPDGTKAYAEGVRHRRRVVEPIASARAMHLSAAGVPVTLDHAPRARTRRAR